APVSEKPIYARSVSESSRCVYGGLVSSALGAIEGEVHQARLALSFRHASPMKMKSATSAAPKQSFTGDTHKVAATPNEKAVSQALAKARKIIRRVAYRACRAQVTTPRRL